MRGQVFVAAGALAAALMATPAQAQQYPTYHQAHVANSQCQQAQQNRTVGGALIGGIAGAVLGHNVAGGHGSRDEGTALGAVVGALAGGAIGRSTVGQCVPPNASAYDPYNGQSYSQYPSQDEGYYDKDDEDLYGGPQDSNYYGDDDYNRDDCRMGQVISQDRYGRERRDDVMLCRGSDGRWRPQD